tara:strand:- start:246 stop:503 length:258 start_codon:yes stop_codon:yes gene_type:complete
MNNKPSTTAYVNVEHQDFGKKLMQGKVIAGNFEWDFTWQFGTDELVISPPLGRALIKDSLTRFLIKDDYKLEPGGNYIFTIRAKF